MFFRRKSIDAEIAGLDRRRGDLSAQLRDLEAKLDADHAEATPARRDALVDDYARRRADLVAKLAIIEDLTAKLRDQKREQEATAARLDQERRDREAAKRRADLTKQFIDDAAAFDAALRDAAAAAERLQETSVELARAGVPHATQLVARGPFTRAVRAAGLGRYADIDYAPVPSVRPLKESAEIRLASTAADAA